MIYTTLYIMVYYVLYYAVVQICSVLYFVYTYCRISSVGFHVLCSKKIHN